MQSLGHSNFGFKRQPNYSMPMEYPNVYAEPGHYRYVLTRTTCVTCA